MSYSEDTMESAEMELEELQQHPEATQLELLMYESEHIMEHGVQPSQEWYEARFLKIYQYSELNWSDFTQQFHARNPSLAEMSHRIQHALAHLVEEWGVSPIFDLSIYYGALHDMNELWKYYSAEYMDEQEDEEVSDLIVGLRHL